MRTLRWKRTGIAGRLIAGGLLVAGVVALLLVQVASTRATTTLTLPSLTLASRAQPTFDAGWDYSVAVCADGSLWAWGNNGNNQLGDGTTADRLSPVRIGTDTDWAAVSAGNYTTFGIKSNGTLWAWGLQWYGAAGLGVVSSVQNVTVPTRIGISSDWVAVSAGYFFSLALKADGSLWAWGCNGSGRLGDGTTEDRSVPTRIGTETNWVAISAGQEFSLALKSDGTLWAWGSNEFGQLGVGTDTFPYATAPMRVGLDHDWVDISASYSHSLALKSNGTLWAWGSDSRGQLGDGGPSESKLAPMRVTGATDWARASAGGLFSIALKANGGLLSWGYGTHGELGNGGTSDKYSPYYVSEDRTAVAIGEDWVALSAAEGHSLALKSNGTLWAWGWNERGGVGNGGPVPADVLKPVQVLTQVKIPVAGLITPGTSPSTTVPNTTSTTGSTTTTTLYIYWAFTDTAASPYGTAIESLAAEGIVSGFEDHTFRPNVTVKRQQFAKMIVKTMGYPVTGSEVCPYTDVAAQIGTDPLYPSKYVAVCASVGITKGTSATTFNATGDITRQQLMSMVARAAGLTGPPAQYSAPFSAAQFSTNEHYLNACKAAVAGLLDGLVGIGPAYDFTAPATRGECAQILYNLQQMP